MKADNYNPKAKEVFGKSLIDIGVAIFKGIILLFTVVPLANILQIAINGKKQKVSILELIFTLPVRYQWTFIGFLLIAFYADVMFPQEGLRHLHENDKEKSL